MYGDSESVTTRRFNVENLKSRSGASTTSISFIASRQMSATDL